MTTGLAVQDGWLPAGSPIARRARARSGARAANANAVPAALRRKLAKREQRKYVRYRLDNHKDALGRYHAVLTITLPNGHELRISEMSDPKELIEFYRSNQQQFIGFSLKSIAKGIGKVAKGIANSKVFKAASSVLGTIAPALGPLAPAAMAASTGMKAATYLLAAKQHEAAGNLDAVGPLVDAAAETVNFNALELDAAAALVAKAAPNLALSATPGGGGGGWNATGDMLARVRATAAAKAAPPAPPPPPKFDAAKFAAADWGQGNAAAEAKRAADYNAQLAAKKKADAAAKKKADKAAAKAKASAERKAAAKAKRKADKAAAKAAGKKTPLLQFGSPALTASASAKATSDVAAEKVFALILRPA